MSGRAVARLVVGVRPLIEVLRWARAALADGATVLELDVPDPGDAEGSWPGAPGPDGAPQRSWRAWLDFADLLGCRCHTPTRTPEGSLRLRFSRLGPEAPWHRGASGPGRYADESGFGAVRKMEQPGFLLPLLAALERARPPDGGRALVLGCHRGDEIEALGWLDPPAHDLRVVGVDHAPGPLAQARERYPGATFLEADVGDLPADLGRFHLVLAVAVLQGTGVDDKGLLRRLVQHHLEPRAALVLGLPNSRFVGGEVLWGARTRNYREPDLSLLVRDLAAHRRYLQQHGFVTHIGGRYDLLLSAWRRPPQKTLAANGSAPPAPTD